MINLNNKYGFTIMEVLLALVISCIVMVASVPIITVQKNYGHVEKWERTPNNSDVFYGTPKDNLKVGIGTNNPKARLHVRGYDNLPNPVMTIRSQNNVASVIFANNRLKEIGRVAIDPINGANGGNVGIGKMAANKLGTGSARRSIAIGPNSASSNSSAWYNVSIGLNSLAANTSGDSNVIIGQDAARDRPLSYNSARDRNYIIGDHETAQIPSSATRNVLIGDEAGASANLGSQNIIIGGFAGQGSRGSNNIFIGRFAGQGLSDSNRIIIGNIADTTTNVGLLSNYVDSLNLDYTPLDSFDGSVTGTNSLPNNKKIIGGILDIQGTTTTNLLYADVEANTVITATHLDSYKNSDKRLKNITGDYKKSVEDLKKIKIYSYTYKSDGPDGMKNAGVIAQDIKDILPDAVLITKKGTYMVNYDYLNMASLNAINDLQKRNKELKKRVEALKKAAAKSDSNKCVCN